MLNKTTKAGMSSMLAVGAPGKVGDSFNKEDSAGKNSMDASTFLFDGDHTGDQVIATYSIAKP